MGVNDDRVFNAQEHNQTIRGVNQTVLRSELEPTAIASNAPGILWHHTIHCGPATDITPAKIALERQNLSFGAGLFQYAIVNRQARHLSVFAREQRTKRRIRINERLSFRFSLDSSERFGDPRLVSCQ